MPFGALRAQPYRAMCLISSQMRPTTVLTVKIKQTMEHQAEIFAKGSVSLQPDA
jgi:hypothetical protein